MGEDDSRVGGDGLHVKLFVHGFSVGLVEVVGASSVLLNVGGHVLFPKEGDSLCCRRCHLICRHLPPHLPVIC